MTFETWQVIIGVITVIAGVLGGFIPFFYKLKKDNRKSVEEVLTQKFEKQLNEAERYINLKRDVDNLEERLDALQGEVKENKQEYKEMFEEIKSGIKSIHDKIDEHYKIYHSKKD